MGVARFKEPRTQAVVFGLDMSKQKQAEAIALETRTIEQTGIARQTHDVLLQNFQAMIFRFQAARNLMPRHPDEALRSLFVECKWRADSYACNSGPHEVPAGPRRFRGRFDQSMIIKNRRWWLND
jgi:hypothetical protein